MKKLLVFLAVLGLVAFGTGSAMATGFYAATNELGYTGTIWNITDGTGPWSTASPRLANIYTVVGVPGNSDYNIIASNWYEHSQSNQNNSFFQLYEVDNASVTSSEGGWDPTLTTFSMTISGANAPYPWSRFWQPDNGVAWGVTFTEYTYTLTAKFSTAAVADSGGYTNSGDPYDIYGTFTGIFVVTYDVNKNPITNGDLYGFAINYSDDLFVGLDALDADGNPTSVYNSYGTAPVPEPGTLLLLGSGLMWAAAIRRKFRK